MTKSKVAAILTSPRTVRADYQRLMDLLDYRKTFAAAQSIALKVNISWHFFYPACSTTPWQLDGIVRTLIRDGFPPEKMWVCQNRTVVVDAHRGERANKILPVIQEYGLPNIHLYEHEKWCPIEQVLGHLTQKFRVLNKIFPEGFSIPQRLIGCQIVHLPTMKTHVFTTTTGAMKNAFGGLLNEQRHLAHPWIHDALIDLLYIQQQIHPGILAVMDGTFAGDGPGPRCLQPFEKNLLLASTDQVAIDAVAAKIMGFQPLSLRYIQGAHEQGLGCGDPRSIEIVGDQQAVHANWHFVGPHRQMTFAARMQHAIYWGPLKKLLAWSLKSPLAPWSYWASIGYHDYFWYRWRAPRYLKSVEQSQWLHLFNHWETVPGDERGFTLPDLKAA